MSLKIKPEHYEVMKAAIKSAVERIGLDNVKTHKKDLVNDSRVKDLERRFRWDLFKAAKLTKFCCESLYSYLMDSHIDSALKQIVKDLEL